MTTHPIAPALQQLDDELTTELCAAFHGTAAQDRQAHLYALAQQKQASVPQVLTRILDDKKHSLPFLLSQDTDNIERPRGLQVAVLDRSAEGLHLAARLANKPFKQAVRALATELGIPTDQAMTKRSSSFSASSSFSPRVFFGPMKSLAGIISKQKRLSTTNIFDLNRATIAFADEAELKAILAALPRYFDEVVSLDNKFRQQWEQATQPPCLHLNLRLKRETLPAQLLGMLLPSSYGGVDGGAEGGWIVELQLSMLDFLDVKKRCHPIYEILRLRVEEGAEQKSKEKEVGKEANREEEEEAMMKTPKMLPLPRACPVCGLLQHYVKSSQLVTLEDVSFGQKLVKKCLLLDDKGRDDKGDNKEDKHEKQNEAKKEKGGEVAFSIIAINHNSSCFSELEPIFVREVGLLTRLDHPNVLQICGVVRDDRYLGFVTQWVSSGTLWSWLQQKKKAAITCTTEPPPPHQNPQQTQSSTNAEHPLAHHTVRQEEEAIVMDVWDIAFQLCDALHYVHSHGVVHYDLKSSNVLLDQVDDADDDADDDGNGNNTASTPAADGSATQRRKRRSKLVVKLFDFGLSREIESTLRTAAKVGGPPNWQAPETWSELTSTSSSAVDVYSFGCVLIELFGQFLEPGCFPWMQFKRSDKASRKHIMNRVKNHRAKPPELDLVDDPLIYALIIDCLAFEPTLRPSMKRVKARLLAAFVDSPIFDSKASRIFAAMNSGRLSFSSLFSKLRRAHSPSRWAETLSFLRRYSGSMSQFEVALAMCRHFAPCSSMEDSKKKANHKQEETKRESSSSLFEVCERHMEELVVAKFLVGWCCARGVGGVAMKDEERAVMLYRQAAAQGYPAAQFHLGKMSHFQGGDGESCSIVSKEQREQEAFRWFEKAAKQGHVGAQLRLIKCYQLGEGVEVDWAMGEKWLQQATVRLHRLSVEQGNADAQSNLRQSSQECKIHLGGGHQATSVQVQGYLWAAKCFDYGKEDQDQDTVELSAGNSDAQCNLGVHYSNGTGGVQKDKAEAVRLYTLSAEQGNAQAQCNLAVCYAKGRGVQRDEDEAVRLYRLSAEQGIANAQYMLAWRCANGRGVQRDEVESVRLYRLSAEQGNSYAQCHLGVCYANGRGVQRDEVEAVRLYRLSAEQGNADAQCRLGVCYSNGRGVQRDEVEAVRLYRLSAEQGNAIAQCQLGLCYANGTGVQRNHDEAVRLFRPLAEQGNAYVQYYLGLCYANGTGVQKDEVEAVRLYRLSAEQGNRRAQCKLGVFYAKGTGVQRDEVESVRLFRLSAGQGHAHAQYKLAVCYANGTGVLRNEAEAVRLYRLSAEQGNADAQCKLGLCYADGTGVQRDEVEAVRLCRLAAEQGNAEAQCHLGVYDAKGTGVQR